MERECCLTMLIILNGGATLLACGWWPTRDVRASNARRLEIITWRRLWLPLLPAMTVAASLCGWALSEPDPVPEKVPIALLLMSLMFALVFARAITRAGWSLIAERGDPATATVGLLRTWIVFSPQFVRTLSERQVEAALEHERAHVRHRDPLRIWLAQFAADLQWPWPQARERLRRWLLALEVARDEEALAAGVEGLDLADAILASARFEQQVNLPPLAALTGESVALEQRIARLLAPPSANLEKAQAKTLGVLLMLAPTLLVAVVLGSTFGERVIRVLFRIAA